MFVTGLGQCSLDYLAVIDGFPRENTKKEVLEWRTEGGGPVATALAALSRLGVKCRFHGVVGDDDAGEKIASSLRKEGVGIAGLKVRKNSSSQIAFIAVDKGSGKRTIFWRRPTGSHLSRRELGKDFLGKSGFLLLDGLMAGVSLYAAQQAKKRGIPVMLDAGRLRPGMMELARLSDYAVVSEDFSRELGWKLQKGDLLKRSRDLCVRALTVTLGEKGSVTAAGDDYFKTPAFLIRAKDTTGAGDVFHGAYAYGILRGWNIRETARFASAAAALKCRELGGRRGIPSLEEVLAFLSSAGK